MEWNQDSCIKLIGEFQKSDILWNPRHPSYYNKLEREDAWTELAILFEKPSDEVKKKIDSLKGSYRREKARMKKKYRYGKEEAGEAYVSRWFAFGLLKFLDDKEWPRRASSISSHRSPKTEPIEAINEDASEGSDERMKTPSEASEDEANNTQITTPQATNYQSYKTPSSRKRPCPVVASVEGSYDRLDKIPTENGISLGPATENEFDLFCKSLAVQLKNMPLDRALICQEKLQRVMTEERMSQYRESIAL